MINFYIDVLDNSLVEEYLENTIGVIDDLPQPDYGCLHCKFEWAPELLPASDIVKVRFKVWISIGINGDLQQYAVYEIFPDGLVRLYRYEGISRKAIDKR